MGCHIFLESCDISIFKVYFSSVFCQQVFFLFKCGFSSSKVFFLFKGGFFFFKSVFFFKSDFTSSVFFFETCFFLSKCIFSCPNSCKLTLVTDSLTHSLEVYPANAASKFFLKHISIYMLISVIYKETALCELATLDLYEISILAAG